ncbi:Putative transposase [Stieleria maiorica]|uniref:Transposase n=1 Tax=Stieleria maiorica TaxID=2795974 RepID=A0A5B9MSC2_9BACT|nr:Putative transposase [Stieleria maiorica]
MIPPTIQASTINFKFDWGVNIKPVRDGRAVLKYLAPYVYRVAISDNRIVSVDEQGVTDSDGRWLWRRQLAVPIRAKPNRVFRRFRAS